MELSPRFGISILLTRAVEESRRRQCNSQPSLGFAKEPTATHRATGSEHAPAFSMWRSEKLQIFRRHRGGHPSLTAAACLVPELVLSLASSHNQSKEVKPAAQLYVHTAYASLFFILAILCRWEAGRLGMVPASGDQGTVRSDLTPGDSGAGAVV